MDVGSWKELCENTEGEKEGQEEKFHGSISKDVGKTQGLEQESAALGQAQIKIEHGGLHGTSKGDAQRRSRVALAPDVNGGRGLELSASQGCRSGETAA